MRISTVTFPESIRQAPSWRKHGKIFSPPDGHAWMKSHAALPTALVRDAQACDVYFASRDASSRSHIGRFSFDPSAPQRVSDVSSAPLLSPGPLGAFDDSGVTPSCIVHDGDRLLLYYTGWMLGQTVPFYYAIGLAVSDDDGRTFHCHSPAPILDRCPCDPYLSASPWVMRDQGLWRMWYVSGVRWELRPEGPRHYYHIKYAESTDGLHWQRDGRVCIDFASADEYAIARPTVMRDGNLYRMWFPHRGQAYRIGYAESADGLLWTRQDDRAGIDAAPIGWDSEMVTYPCVLDAGNNRYMLYNGNGYGRTGIGLAQLLHV